MPQPTRHETKQIASVNLIYFPNCCNLLGLRKEKLNFLLLRCILFFKIIAVGFVLPWSTITALWTHSVNATVGLTKLPKMYAATYDGTALFVKIVKIIIKQIAQNCAKILNLGVNYIVKLIYFRCQLWQCLQIMPGQLRNHMYVREDNATLS